MGEIENEPTLRDLLHPGADRGSEGAEPENPEVAVGESGEGAFERQREFIIRYIGVGPALPTTFCILPYRHRQAKIRRKWERRGRYSNRC